MCVQIFLIESSNFAQITIYHYNLTYSNKQTNKIQKANKTKQSLSKNNQSLKRFRLQNFIEYIFISCRKFYGKIIYHGLPFIFAFNSISPKIVKAAYNRKKQK